MKAKHRCSVNGAFSRYEDSPAQLKLSILDDDEEGVGCKPLVLIEGDEQTLRFLSDVLAAVANDTADHKCSFAPDGAGSIHFDKTSEFGLYIHRLPCPDAAE